jgi:hypothetical protein
MQMVGRITRPVILAGFFRHDAKIISATVNLSVSS